jgi:tetratricopeptide (TPR) repeat protein
MRTRVSLIPFVALIELEANALTVTRVKTIKNWLEPEDPVLCNMTEFTANFAQEREESTCLWMAPFLTRFLKSDQKTMFVSGKPGSGKSILAMVINDYLQYPIRGAMYKSIFVPISESTLHLNELRFRALTMTDAHIVASTTPRAIAKSILSQLFSARIGNVQLFEIISDAHDHCQKTVFEEQYDNELWRALGLALQVSLQGAKELVLVVDGVDEASCGQNALVKRLKDATLKASTLTVIILGTQKEEASAMQTAVHITPELIFDDVAAVVRRILQPCHAFGELTEEQREITVAQIAEAANGSFLWAKLAAERIRDDHMPNGQGLVKAVDALAKAELSITDLVVHRLESKVSDEAKRMLVWLATAIRPLTLRELSALLSIRADKGTIMEARVDPLMLLRPLMSLVFCQNNMVSLRHGQIRTAIIDTINKAKLFPTVGNKHVDLVRRLLLYIKLNVTDEEELSETPISSHRTSKMMEQFPLLDFALRYWANHTKIALGSETDQQIHTVAKELRPFLPIKPIVPLLEMTVWQAKSTPVLKSLHGVQVRLYQQILTVDHPATLQAIICQALFYREIRDVVPSETSDIFYHAAAICHKALSAQHVITRKTALDFLESTADQITKSRTQIMIRRTEMLQLLVECYKVQYGQSSGIVITTLTQLVEHFKYINEEHKAQQLAASLQTSLTESTTSQSTVSHQSDESLLVHLHGRRPSVQEATTFALDDIEADEPISQIIDSQSSLYREIKSHVHSIEEETASRPESTTTESSFLETISSTSATHSSSITAARSLTDMYWSQHRWKDATKSLKAVLRRVWPSFFSPSVQDVVLPSENVDRCIDLAERLRDCYRFRGRAAKGENISLRLYYSVRRGRPIGDELRERVTRDLLQLCERKDQTDQRILVHQDILNDLTKKFGEDHPAVLKELLILADLARPRSASVSYHRRIVQILNKHADTCHPEAFESLLIVATELSDQGQYSEAREAWKILFNTLPHPNINPKLRDQAFVKSVYERYTQCLRMTHAELHVIHDVTVQYRKTCETRFGASASITIQAMTRLLDICRESKRYEAEAAQICEQLLRAPSIEADIDQDELRAILDAHYEEQYASIASAGVESVPTEQIQRVITIRRERLTTIRATYGWAHETTLSEMKELVALYIKRGELQPAVSMLQEASLQIVSKETSASRLAAAAQTIASSYIAAGQVQRAKELCDELYRKIVVKETATTNFVMPSGGRQSLVFLAHFEHNLRKQKEPSLTVSEIHWSLCAEYVYFERYRSESRSKSSTLENIVGTGARLYGLLRARNQESTAARLMDDLANTFVTLEKEKAQVNFGQAKAFIGTLLEYFSMYTTKNFLRSVAIASYRRVTQLLTARDYQAACDLAVTAFKYLQAHNGFSSSLSVVKLVFNLGLAISGQGLDPRPDSATRRQILSASSTIVSATLGYCKQANIDLTHLDLVTLNKLVKLLDAQGDYANLAWLLTGLWNSRDQHPPSQQEAAYTLALGRMLVITRYLMGEYMAAIRLAEDIVYNCARVHGRQHPSTIEMTVLLSQMYTSVAHGYQGQKERRELAYRYYKKAAALHENALRTFIDPTALASPAIDEGASSSGSESGLPSPGERPEDSGKYVRQHLHLLKLAVERLGNWPKEYKEYEKLSSALFQAFGDDLKGVEGVDKWNLKNFGSGRAEASDDLISPKSHPAFGLGEQLAIAV